MSIPDRIRALAPEMTRWRHDFHAHPEVGFEEVRTSGIVADALAAFGYEVHRNVGRTGVVGRLKVGSSNRSVGLRCDMDALPMEELTQLSYRSTNPGRMHACGHDGHTSSLLGAAKYLAETKNFDGTVTLIFQPAEEGVGGARAMLADGLLERFPCEVLFGYHNSPKQDLGTFAIRPGVMMAGGAFFDIAIQGRGAHGAMPHYAIDPVVVAAQIVTGMQAIVARQVPATESGVLSATRIEGGDAYNVIPDRAHVRGTARFLTHETGRLMEDGLKRLAKGIAAGFGASVEVDWRLIFAPLVNQDEATSFAAEVAAELVGEDKVDRNRDVIMASEDFSFMLEKVPGAYINIGNGDSAYVHNPAYDFNDQVLPLAAAFYARVVERKLART